jgi:hypothetical protein
MDDPTGGIEMKAPTPNIERGGAGFRCDEAWLVL